MASHPRLTAADAETLLIAAGFRYLDRRGHHRIYGRARTRVIVPFDGRPELHPKIVRMVVESMERSRPAVSFEIDRTLVSAGEPAPPSLDAPVWDAGEAASAAGAPPEPPQRAAAKPAPPPDAPPRPPDPRPEGEDPIDLPRRPRPKAPWS